MDALDQQLALFQQELQKLESSKKNGDEPKNENASSTKRPQSENQDQPAAKKQKTSVVPKKPTAQKKAVPSKIASTQAQVLSAAPVISAQPSSAVRNGSFGHTMSDPVPAPQSAALSGFPVGHPGAYVEPHAYGHENDGAGRQGHDDYAQPRQYGQQQQWGAPGSRQSYGQGQSAHGGYGDRRYNGYDNNYGYGRGSSQGFAGQGPPQSQHWSHAEPQPQKPQKKVIRAAGGEVWEDPTLAEWPENDFRLFVGDLGNEVNDEVLSHAFSKYPSFQKAKVVRDRHSRKTKGYGFVSFGNPFDCGKALKEMNGRYIGNRPVKISKSKWQDRNADVAIARMKKKKNKKHLFSGLL